VATTRRLGWWQVTATAQCVPQLRRALLAAISGRGLDDDAVALAISEALANVVLHAYPTGEGLVTLTAEMSPTELVVIVADHGIGARSFEVGSAASGLGLGLALIHELCSTSTTEPTSDGTTITMSFTTTAT
jgi:serine/threonine-protein kinase RsbW